MPCIAQRNRPLLLQGTLTTFRRRCGKPTCRCAAGEPHESPALRFTEDGRTKTLTLTAAEVAQVTAALARYEQAKADLDAQAAEGIARLRDGRVARGSTPDRLARLRVAASRVRRSIRDITRTVYGACPVDAGG